MVNLKLKEQLIEKNLDCIIIAHGNIYAGRKVQFGSTGVKISNPHLVKKNIMTPLLDEAFITAPYFMSEVDSSTSN